jgi:hypothetical protein
VADDPRSRADLPNNDPGVTIRAMFANLRAYGNRNVFAGTHGPAIGMELSTQDHAVLLAAGAEPFGPADRPMGSDLTSLTTAPPSPYGSSRRWTLR